VVIRDLNIWRPVATVAIQDLHIRRPVSLCDDSLSDSVSENKSRDSALKYVKIASFQAFTK
jgi:hypothetical protein